jgi:hypothetical protein
MSLQFLSRNCIDQVRSLASSSCAPTCSEACSGWRRWATPSAPRPATSPPWRRCWRSTLGRCWDPHQPPPHRPAGRIISTVISPHTALGAGSSRTRGVSWSCMTSPSGTTQIRRHARWSQEERDGGLHENGWAVTRRTARRRRRPAARRRRPCCVGRRCVSRRGG